jgi:TP901 family phage tail tape measure protein
LNASKNAALDWSKKHLDAVDVYLAANTQMASAGLNSVQAIAGTEAALSAARANMGDVGESTELLATLYNNMGDKANDAGAEMAKLADVLTVTMQAFQIKDLNTLGEGLKYAVPSALQFRLSIQEVNTVIGMLNTSGLKGGQAGTSFAAAMRNMNKASAELGFSIARTADGGTDFIKTLENIKNMYGDFSAMTAAQQEAFKRAFGDEGLRVISLLLNKTGDLNKALLDITNSAGATAQALGTIEGTTASKAAIAMSKLEALKIEIGDKILGSGTLVDTILPGFIGFVQALGDLAVGFMETFPGLTTFIVCLGAIVFGSLAVIGPIMMATSTVMLFGGNALIVFAKVQKGWGKLSDYLGSDTFTGKITAIKNSMISAFSTGRDAALRCANAVRSLALSIGRAGIAMIRAAAQGVAQFVIGLIGMARQAIATAATALPALIASVWRCAIAMATAAALGVAQFAIGLAGLARQAIITAAAALPALIASVWAFTVALLANPLTWVVLGIMALITAIALCVVYFDDFSKAVGNAIKYAEDSIDGVLAYLDSKLPDFMKSGSALWEAFGAGIKTAPFGPAKAVMIGLSLVRDLLPFSDAKAGPLSQLTENGRRLLATIGEGVEMEAPNFAAGVGQAVNLDKHFPGREGGETGGAGGRPIVIQGNVIIKVDKLDNQEAVANVFKTLSMQFGGA